MRFFRTSPLVMALAVICVALLSPASVQADPFILTPNGNPTGPSMAFSDPMGNPPMTHYVYLDPAEAITGGIWPAGLTLEQMLADYGGVRGGGFSRANGWTINRFSLSGNNWTLRTYAAYAQTPPPITFGGQPFQPPPLPFSGGGAELKLDYAAGAGTQDPSGPGVHWIQVVQSNQLGKTNSAVQVGNDYYFIDDGQNPNWATQGPFYDAPGANGMANSNEFADDPGRGWDAQNHWRGMVFIATWDQNRKIINVSSQSVYWGFQEPVLVAPEPSTLVLFCSGVPLLIGVLRRRAQERRVLPSAVSSPPWPLAQTR